MTESATSSAEVLGAGHDGGQRHPRVRLLWAVLLVATALTAAGVEWDGRARSGEAIALAACKHDLRVASWHSESRLGLLSYYEQPAPRTDRGVQQLHLADLMARQASGVLPAAQAADRTCRAVSVHPWHFALVARRDAALAYSGALVTLLQTVAAQGSAGFHDDAVLIRLQTAAGAG